MASNILTKAMRVGQTVGRKAVRASPRVHPYSTGKVQLPAYLLNSAPTKISTLPNKLRVATEEAPGETATIGVFIDAGSVYENDKNNGTAHFLEHMAFKGTANRTQQQIELEVENMGAQLNAYTSREQTVYIARAFKNDVPKMLEILSDILQNSKLDAAAIERERSVILKEKEVVEDNVEEIIFDYLHSAAYQGTPLARTILGSTNNIRSITRNDLTNYIRSHYTTPRMVVAASGAVNHDQVCELANKNFATLPQTSDFDFSSLGNFEFTGSDVRVRDDAAPQVNAALAFEGVSWSDPDYVTFMLIQSLVGNWDRGMGSGVALNSRLAEIAAEEELMHSFSTFNTCYNKTGLFGVHLTADYKRIDDACWQVMNEFQTIGKEITEGELERAKNRVKAAYLMQLDGTNAVAEDIGRQVLTLGRRVSPVEFFMRVDNVTTSDVKRVCDTYLNDVDPVVSAYGPLKHMPDYNYLRRWTFSGRF